MRMSGFRFGRCLAILSGCAFSTCLTATEVERFSIVAGGEIVGKITAVDEVDRVSIDYDLKDNGRGPTQHETLQLNSEALPVSWKIDGRSTFGGPFSERFQSLQAAASWATEADVGSVSDATHKLYISDDASPFALSVYLRALLRSAQNHLDLLPSGSANAQLVREAVICGVPTNFYAVSGVDLAPAFVGIDSKQRLIGVLGQLARLVIRAGCEQDSARLREITASLYLERAQAIQRKIAHIYSTPVRIENVHIFDPITGQLSPPKSVDYFNGRITTIQTYIGSEKTPQDMVVVDGGGGTLIPGLHDMHTHTTAADIGLFYLAAGVTTVRDMGNDNVQLANLAARFADKSLAGPNVIANGLLEGRSPYSSRMGIIADSEAKAVEAVDWYAERGYFQIKIYNSVHPDWIPAIATEAHRLGLRVTGHIPAFATAEQCIEDGYDELTHANLLALNWVLRPEEDTRTPLRITALDRFADVDLQSDAVQHTLRLMQVKHVAHDPTLAILERIILSRNREVQPGDVAYLDHMPIGYQRYRRRDIVGAQTPEKDAAYRAAFRKMLEMERMLHAQGIQLLPGTDDPTGIGFVIHRELELYTRIGMSPAEALRAATSQSAQYLGRGELEGTIARGKLADFFLVPGDVTQDISQIREIRMVVRGGTMYFPQEIYGALGVKPFATPPLVHQARVPN